MKITRHTDIVMYEPLGAMALDHINEDTLDVVMDNFNVFRKVDEDMKKLNEELSNRLYVEVDKEEKDVSAHEIRVIFTPMFKKDEIKENDFSELDEILSE